MAKAPKKSDKRPEIQDEPGADQRFDNILKRALNTPPKRKKTAGTSKPAPAARSGKHRKDRG